MLYLFFVMYTVFEKLKSLYAERREAISDRLKEFSCAPSHKFFYELVYCLLTPQSSAVNAMKIVSLLYHHDFLHSPINPEPFLRQKDCYVRFHRTKTKYLLACKKQFPIILKHLMSGSSSEELREWLVKNVKGIGWKEASHFLRNIGHRNLAILDRHILRNLIKVGVLQRPPKALTKKHYLAIEKKFRKFALGLGIPMDELDLLFWSMETGKILK